MAKQLSARIATRTSCWRAVSLQRVERRLRPPPCRHDLCRASISGFSIDNSVRILNESAQESLAEYFARPPISLKKIGYESLSDGDEEVLVEVRKRAWARLLAKVYEVDPMVCPKCGAEMTVIAAIEDPDELGRILRHLVKMGRSPPGFDPDRLN